MSIVLATLAVDIFRLKYNFASLKFGDSSEK